MARLSTPLPPAVTALPRSEPARRAPAPPALSPVVISLPNGLDLGGVTTWSVRLANGLAQRGHSVTLVVHPIGAGGTPARVMLDPQVQRIDVPASLPSMHQLAGDLSPLLRFYRDLVERLALISRAGPVAYLPNILGDSYAIGAALCVTHPELLRIVAWQHTDSDYDTALLTRYEPVIARFVAIDDRYVEALRRRFPHRRDDVVTVPHGVAAPSSMPPARPPLFVAGSRPGEREQVRPLRLLYTGRIEHQQKRILALVSMSEALRERGVTHELTIIGDGSAREDLDARIAESLARDNPGSPGAARSLRRLPPMSPDDLTPHYQRADAFVLASRYEGLCISRIEAAAQGCVPILTRRNSGATSGLKDGESAVLVDAASEMDEAGAGSAMAEAVERFLSLDRDALAAAAWHSTRDHFSIHRHLDAFERVVAEAGASPARFWRGDRAPAFSTSGEPGDGGGFIGAEGSGSLGPRAASNLRALLDQLHATGCRGVVLHGAGRHTLELAPLIGRSRVPVVGITDDDASRHGESLFGWSILPPGRAGETGASDVIISSYIHADSIWARRAVYETQGLRVHRLYPESDQA